MSSRYPVPLTVRFVIGAIDVTVPAYQWGQQEGRVFFERVFGTSYAHLFRERFGAASSMLAAVFVNQTVTIDLLRDIALAALRSGDPVTVYPDAADTGTSWEVDWQSEAQFTRIVEGRDEYSVMLLQRRP